MAQGKARPDAKPSRLRIYTAFVHIPAAERRKIDPKRIKCIFIGYCQTQKARRFWDPNACRIKVSRNAIFYEKRQFDFFSPVANPIEGNLNIDNPPICNETETAPSIPTDFNQSCMNTASPEMNHPSEDSLQLPEPTPVATPERIYIHPPTNPSSEDTMTSPATPIKEPNVRRSKRLKEHKALHSQLTSHSSPNEPNYYTDAISSPVTPLWKAVI
jgi:hypothetical protein